MKFRTTVEVEAIRWTGDNFAELARFAGKVILRPGVPLGYKDDDPLQVFVGGDRGEGRTVLLYRGAWLIKSPRGEFNVLADDYFRSRYEPITADEPPAREPKVSE